MRNPVIWLGLAVVLAALPANAQQSDNPRDEIVVHGQRIDDAVRAFVGEVSVAQSRENQIARWDRSICTRVVGLPAAQAQFLADQIARRAHDIGLTPGASGCAPNVLLFVARDAASFTRELVQRYPVMFTAHREANMSAPDDVALQDFIATPRAVRWWHVAQTVTADEQVVGNSDAFKIPGTGQAAMMSSDGAIPTGVAITRSQSSFNRFERHTRQDFQRAVVVVDAGRVGAVTLRSLGDYLAMVTLAQLEMNASVGDESILSLFSASSAPTALTAWDTAYLDGLYHAPRNARNARQQEGAITARMHQTLDH